MRAGIHKYRASQSVSQHEAPVKANPVCLWREGAETAQRGHFLPGSLKDRRCVLQIFLLIEGEIILDEAAEAGVKSEAAGLENMDARYALWVKAAVQFSKKCI